MLIKKLENKIKLTLFISVGTLLTALIVVVVVLNFAFKLINEERKNVYVLNGGTPFLVQRTDISANEEVEMRSHINMFHSLFFSLPPDDEFIKTNINAAMYLVDESGLKQYNDLREKGYYNAILANSMAMSIKTDSILLDLSNSEDKKFIYYGTQRIERETSTVKRRLVTEGRLRNIARTNNNPHGIIITNWKTLLNEDISIKPKKVF